MRYLQLIFVFVFVFIGLLNVIFRVAASKRKKQKEAGAFGAGDSGNSPQKKIKAETLLPGEAREYSEYKDEEINAEPVDGFTGPAVPGREAAGLTVESDIEKPVLTRDMAAGSSPRRPVSGQAPLSSLLKTETSSGYERFASGIAGRLGSPNAVSVHGSNMSGSDIKRDQITAWEKINKLSILKRAVVLSEILGPPKGSV